MKNQLKTLVLLGVLSALLVGVGSLIAPSRWALFAAVAATMNLLAYFFSDRLVLAASRARLLGEHEAPELHRMLAELASRAGIPTPRLYLAPDAQPNAFATGRNPARGAVAVTESLLHLLDRRQLRGVLAHEVAHIENRDILLASVAAGIAAVFTQIAHTVGLLGALGCDDDSDEPGPVASLLLLLVAPVAATLVQLGISRSREYVADETAARLTGDPEALASALEALEYGTAALPARVEPATASLYIANPFGSRGLGWLASLFSTHPPVGERVKRLRVMASASGSARPGRYLRLRFGGA